MKGNIQPQIKYLAEKKLVGVRLSMSLVDNKTKELWQSFISLRKKITNPLTTTAISLQIYPPDYHMNFEPSKGFEKWAAMEVVDFSAVPSEMETLLLPSGYYAVFAYKGSSADTRIFQYIFANWLPNSGYQLADRPHFEVLSTWA